MCKFISFVSIILGIVFVINGFSILTESSVHQIYQILSYIMSAICILGGSFLLKFELFTKDILKNKNNDNSTSTL